MCQRVTGQVADGCYLFGARALRVHGARQGVGGAEPYGRNNMRYPISTFTAVVGFLGLSLVIQGETARAGETVNRPMEPYYAFCRSDAQSGNTFYFSATRHIDAGVTRQDLENSFRAFLAEKYQYPHTGVISCVFAVGGDLHARTESSRQQTIDNLRSAKFEVVETEWTYEK